MNGCYSKIVLGLLVLNLTLMFADDSRGGHDKLECTACHETPAGKAFCATITDQGLTPGLVCLACHDAGRDRSGLYPPHVLNGSEKLAGGSFTSTLQTDKTGHNVQWVDGTLGTTPPGGFTADQLTCLSCHDPHTNGNYRNLKKQINCNPTPVRAIGDPRYLENIYISGMNEFCCACHQQFYSAWRTGVSGGWTRHPVGIRIYGAPHADFDYWSRLEVKLTATENPSADPDNRSRAEVFCLTCHRAHASPWPDSMRWDYSQSARGCLECHTF